MERHLTNWPINDLTTRTPRTAAIVGKVIQLWPLTEFEYKGKTNRYINFVLKDQSGSIKVSLYGSTAINAARILAVDGAFRVKNFYIKAATRAGAKNQVSSLFENGPLRTQISVVHDPQSLAALDFQTYTSLKDTETIDQGKSADILAIVSSVGEVKFKEGSNPDKKEPFREIYLYDASKAKVKATLWGRWVYNFGPVGSIVSIRNAKIKHFEGVTLIVGSYATLTVNPESPFARKLQIWNDSEDSTASLTQLSDITHDYFEYKALKEVILEAEFPKMQCVTGRVRLMAINGPPDEFSRHFYLGCPKTDCPAKVTEINGQYYCRMCQNNYSSYKYSMLISVQLVDHTAIIFSTLFSKHLEQIFPFSLHTLYKMSRFDKTLYRLVLAQYLLEKDFQAKFRMSKEGETLIWTVQSLTPFDQHMKNSKKLEAPSSSGSPSPKNLQVEAHENSQESSAMGSSSLFENSIESQEILSSHLGLIDEIDAVPASWREANEQKSKAKQ